ncbi:hypothetical protein [Gemmata palustris]|uniref:hypothetical protein n=1 Tax=Gemmata palustris TaxID=2822762 RepID=UPI001FE7F7B3|nr:hypothetical protein [Gemmata palustris]
MTEAEWLTATGPYNWPHRLFNELFCAGASGRKLRLACVACCRLVAPFSGAPFPSLLCSIEELADGSEAEDRVSRDVESLQSREQERRQVLFRSEGHPTLIEEVEYRAGCAILTAGSPYRDREWHGSRKLHSYPCYVAYEILNATDLLGQRDAAERSIICFLQDIFGPLPFRPVVISSAWRTSTVVALAAQMYESREFGAMPILADAIQDAGCDSEDVLSHCRDAGAPHVRGCWVVDLVLGKE